MMGGLLWYAWPVAITLNGDFSTAWRWAAAGLSMLLSLLAIQLLISVICPEPTNAAS